MPQTETFTRVALEGPIGLGWAIGLGVAVAVGLAVLFFREAGLIGRRIVPFLWLPRMAVVAILLMMLVGPVHQTVVRQTRPRSIAVVADASLSMETVDAPRLLDNLRWSVAADGKSGYRENSTARRLEASDRAVFATEFAHERMRDTLDLLQQGADAEQVAQRFADVLRAVDSAATHLETVAASGTTGSNESDTSAEQIRTALNDTVGERLQQLADAVETGDAARLRDAVVTARRITEELAGIERRLQLLAKSVSRSIEDTAGSRESKQQTQTRQEKVAHMLDATLADWDRDTNGAFQVRRYRFDTRTSELSDATWVEELSNLPEDLDPTSGEPAPVQTNLSGALEQLGRDAAGEPFDAVLLLSDGRHNDLGAAPPLDVARGLGKIQMYVVPVGNPDYLRDVLVHHAQAPTSVMVDDSITFEALVTAYKCAGESCTIELVKDDRVIQSRQLEFDANREDERVAFAVPAKETGAHSYQIRAVELVDEVDADNNVARVDVEVVDRTLNVLLAENLPRWEFRYLLNLFTRDDSLKFDHVIFRPKRTGGGQLKRNPRLPEDLDEWARYRVVILGDIGPGDLDTTSQEELVRFVSERGGALIVIAGPQNMPQAFEGTPLADLLPVEASSESRGSADGFGLQLTSEARSNPALEIGDNPGESERVWMEMSRSLPIYSLSSYSRPKPGGRTLIQAVPQSGIGSTDEEQAFLCWQTVGRGRVVYLAAPTTYQLRLRHGDRYHHRFWGQLIRWSVSRDLAIGSKTVRLGSDKTRYALGDDVEFFVQLNELDGAAVAEAKLAARAQSGDSPIAEIELEADAKTPGRYLGRFRALGAGTYQLTVAGDPIDRLLSEEEWREQILANVVVEPDASAEMENTRCDLPLLEQIAESTGGRLIPPTAAREIAGLLDSSPRVTEEITRKPLWNHGIFLWLVAGCLACEWIIRKVIGLA